MVGAMKFFPLDEIGMVLSEGARPYADHITRSLELEYIRAECLDEIEQLSKEHRRTLLERNRALRARGGTE
jgi:hypothetical protein